MKRGIEMVVIVRMKCCVLYNAWTLWKNARRQTGRLWIFFSRRYGCFAPYYVLTVRTMIVRILTSSHTFPGKAVIEGNRVFSSIY